MDTANTDTHRRFLRYVEINEYAPDWRVNRNLMALPVYDPDFASEAYDGAMRDWADARYGRPGIIGDTTLATQKVAGVLEVQSKGK